MRITLSTDSVPRTQLALKRIQAPNYHEGLSASADPENAALDCWWRDIVSVYTRVKDDQLLVLLLRLIGFKKVIANSIALSDLKLR